MAPRSAGPSHILPSVIALSLLSLGFVIYKVNDFATQTKTLAGHNLEPTPWHFFPPKTFTDETLHDRAYKLIHCSYLACCYKSNEVPERRRPPSSSAKAPKCPEFFRWIHHDLEPWARTRISAAHLETAKQYAAFRVMIVDGRLYVDLYWACVQSRTMFTIWGFLQLLARYKIYAEGYAWSVGLKYIVSCGSLTLIITPQYEDFFSHGLIPKVNYWPISPNAICPSIKSAVDWALGHQSEAKAMGQRGQDFMESLSMDRVYDYTFHLITEYSKLLDFKSDIPASAMEVCTESLLCLADPIQNRIPFS